MLCVDVRKVRRIGIGAAVAVSALVALAPTGVPARAQGQLEVPAAGHATADLVGGHQASTGTTGAGPRAVPRHVLDPAAYQQEKAAAARHAPPRQTGTTATRNSAVVGGLDKVGLVASPDPSQQETPPDTTGAIGPAHYVEFVNSEVAVFSRATLALVSSANLYTFDGFTNPVNAYDVQIQYDPQSKRWFYLNAAFNPINNGLLEFGFSKSSDPSNLTSGWCQYTLDISSANGVSTGTYFPDFPKLGHDNAHVLLTDNTFSSSNFISAQIWSYPKPAAGAISACPASETTTLFGSSAAQLKTSLGNLAFTVIPANTADSSAAGFVVSADGTTHLMTWEVDGSGGSPTLKKDGEITISTFGLPANVPQPGSPFSLDSGDASLTQAVAHRDPGLGASPPEGVWTEHTIAGPGGYYSAVRWYELVPAKCSAGTCPAAALRQQGNVAVPNQFAFNGAISPAMDGTDAVINYNVGSSTLLAQIRSQSRNGTDPLGTMSNEIRLSFSNAADQDFSCVNNSSKVCRWGDYSGASPDPAATNRVWGSNQINGPAAANNGAQWQTVNFAVAADESPTAAFTFTPSAPAHGSPVTFNGTTSTDPDGSISSYKWTFGDHVAGTGATPSHTYSAAGHYQVVLTVTDSSGNTAFTSKVITVT